ncbi:SDR family NAD(P)-dependent oxidoreductase [Streptomyces sp. NPDC046859]|uniref:SDR family NAD(P)-dependent oxidoreductase n=1 Tax=Streptomyces sp. NPDC046859 TaxID=3155734 RepID=UPI0034073BF3
MPAHESPKQFPDPPLRTPQDVRAWLESAVAQAAGLDPDTVDPDRPLAELGLGSRQLVTLAAELSALTGRTLDPSLVFDHPTVMALAEAALDDRPAAPAAPRDPVGAAPQRHDDIAIVSMACRLPGADDPDALWRLLDAGREAVGDVPAGRWDTRDLYDPDPEATGKAYSLRGGYLHGIDRFDAAFFGISPREAAAMDPQQRLLLRTSWEAVERAGIVPATLNGSSTGVYAGLYDGGYLASAGLGQLDGHVGTGTAPSVASGRIAYTLGLRGPAVTVDTACSSSLVALHLAARALAGGECDLALAGGATLLLTPRGHVEFSRLRGLSPSGRCSPFSADADGVVWAEGCSVVLLKRLADARRDGDRVLAVVKGSAINQDGRSQGLSAPSGPAQERVVRAALDAAGLEPHDIDHVEAHGTGTPLGDPIEGRALAAVFGPDRPAGRPLGIGSLKSNIGHTQAAAGIAGVIKTVLALHHERIPASLHAATPTGHIDWAHGGLRVLDEARPWPREAGRVRRAGVSAFGISGTNAHVVLEEAPDAPAPRPAAPPAPALFPLSARSLPALGAQAARLLDHLDAHPGLPLPAVAATLAHHRTHFEHRAVVRAADRDGLLRALRALAEGTADDDVVTGPPRTARTGKVAFVFPGQGSQWPGMARDLLDRDPVFADELDRCDAALRPFTGWSVASVLRGDPAAPDLDPVDVVQPVLFAVMVSLAAVWRARGVRPDAVVGHSQGEVAAACVAGALSLNDAAAVVALRSRALTELSGTGAMAVVALPHPDVERRISGHGGGITVAAVNSGRSTVVSGAADAVRTLVEGLEREQVFARVLDVDYASHSDRVEPVRDAVLDELDGVLTQATAVTWYSTVTGAPVTGELEADYWYRNLREPVRFAPTVERMIADGHRCFLELAPHPSLLTALGTIDEDLVTVGSLRRDEDGPACLDRAAAALHVHGHDVDWRRLVPPTVPVDLPTYAWDEQRHWIGSAAPADAPGLLDRAAHPLLGIQLRSADETRWTFRDEWSAATADWLADHTVHGRTVVSGTTLLELCRAALAVARPDTAADVCGLLLLTPLTLPASGTTEVSVEVSTAGATPEVTVHSRPRGPESADWTLHATASAAEPSEPPADAPPTWPEESAPAWDEGTYARLAALGLGYGPAFQGVREATATGAGTVLAQLSLPAAARGTADPYPVHPALLDAALQVAAALEPHDGRALLPVAMARCVLPPGGATDLVAVVRRIQEPGEDVVLDVTLWDTDGFPAGRLEGVRLRAADPAGLTGGPEIDRHLYELAWTPVSTAGTGSAQAPAGTVVRRWPAPEPGADPVAAAHATAAAALGELRALIALPPDEAPARSVWVTTGAVAATDTDTAAGYAQSVLWGLVRGARAEHPDLGLTLVDVDTDDGDLPLSAVVDTGEPELAVRDGRFLAPRLVRARPAPPGAQPAIPTDGTVLITGGLGAVGRRIARLLAEHGVPRLLLTSRQGPDDPRAVGATAELAALGAQVEVAACDVADEAALADVLARVGDEAPLRGVVHCAGVLADGVLAETTPERLAEVLRPKADGAAHLHRLTAGLDLGLFLLVSSAAGVVGTPGQANYAAANAFLDQLAHHRRASGLPALSVSYGAWAGEGLAAEHADLERMARLGHRALTPEQGGALTARALRHDTAHLVAWSLDLPRLRAAAPAGALWRSLLPARPPAPAGGPTLADRLSRLPETERAARVLALVREEAAQALGLRSADAVRPDQPLRDLGMDSVTAVDLRNRVGTRIGARLPATLLFDHPTPARLTDHLLTTVLGRPVPAKAARPAHTSSAQEPVALVAMACRLPGGARDPDGLWRLVAEGRDAVGPFPAARWDVEALYDPDPDAPGKSYAREGGFLDDIDSFDAAFFGITPKEAAAMDPQQRLLLETAWESLERAGIVPADLAGSSTGVYVGMFGSDYLSGTRLDQLDGYVGTGSALSVASGRLAYTLGLNGPALTVDTACSSSLVAVHLAAQALRSGECDLALAGGVTLMVTPGTFVEFSRLRGLSPTGRCRSFSDAADGAVWAEGAGMLVLKRLGDARRDGDRVLAVLRGTAVNQDGRSQGLSAPNGPAQERVIRRALEQSGLRPADIDHVEAHGTGTTLGDPIEAGALAEVFGASRPDGRPLYVGSLKSNVGHTQAASGVLGLIKVVQSLRNGTLPRTLHADPPSRHVDWADSGLCLLHEETAWPASADRVRRAGVSAFGISGTNAHVILEEAPPAPTPAPPAEPPTGPELFVLSGRGEAGLRGQAAALARHLAGSGTDLHDVAHTLARHRSHFEHRAALVAEDRDELRTALTDLAAGRLTLPGRREDPTGKVAFLYAGHGGQWPGMALDLMSDSEEFAAELTRIDEAVQRHAGWSVLTALRAPEEFSPLERTEYLQPVLFAVNAALTAAWRSVGVTPAAVAGHSLGEIAAAHSAGALGLDDAVAVVTGRARAVVPLAGRGGMLSLDVPRDRAEELLTPYAGLLFVAAVNGPHATAVSGDADALADLRRGLDAQGVGARPLSTPFASHTPLMAPVREDLLARLSGVRGTPTATPLYSTVLAEPLPGESLDAAYWYANLSEPVRFADTVRRLLEDGHRYFVELSPHPSLGAAVEAVAAEAGVDAVAVGTLRRGAGRRDTLLRSLGALHTAGHTPDWTALFPTGRRADLPTYAFARERHWLAPAPATAPGTSPLLGAHVEASDEPGRHLFQTEVDLRDGRFAYLSDHRVTGEVWLPGAAFLTMALEAARTVQDDGDVRLTDVGFLQPLRLDASRPVRLQLVLRPAVDGVRDFTVSAAPAGDPDARWERHVTGRVTTAPAAPTEDDPAALRARCTEPVDLTALHATLATLGIEYGPAFQGLESGRRSPTAAVARLTDRPAAGHLLHPAVLDAAFHTAALPADAPQGRAFVPAGVGDLRHTGLRTTPARVTCALRSVSGDTATLDLRLYDEDDRLLLEARDFRLAALSPLDGALFETRWQPRPAAAEPPAPGTWLVLADASGVTADLARRLDGSVPHVVARAGTEFAEEGPGRYVLDPADPDQMARLLDEAFPHEPPRHVVQSTALDAPAIQDGPTAGEAARLGCLSTLHLVRALADRAWTPRLHIVVRGSQAAGDSTHVTHPEQALAWGFGLAVAQEHPELRTTLVDLPPTGGADALWTQLRHADDERLVALRPDGRHVPRLARTRPDDSGRPAPSGAHLITGGLGGLGRIVAERLAGRGARRLALLARSAPDDDALTWIDGLRERGVTVHLARADVTDRAALTAALDGVRAALGPITGVVHAAGVLDDATLAHLGADRVRSVLAPKVLGTALLTELVPEAEDLVLFASAAGLLGSAGQSAYSAANAFLDAWAHHLALRGRRALSLDWGAWAGVGMVAGSDARAAQTARSGLVALSAGDGGELFDRVLTTSRRQLAPLALDWELLALDPDAVRTRPILADLVTVSAPATGADELVEKVLAATDDAERAVRLEAYVRARIAEISGGAAQVPATTALKELGLDSLMLVRLRNAFARDLGVELPAATVFSASDLRGLAEALRTALPERTATARDEADGTAEVPAEERLPATRDVVRLLRSAPPGMPEAAHAVGLAVRLTAPVTRATLTGVVDRLVARHAALRTAVTDPDGGGRVLRVRRDLAATPLRWTVVPDDTEPDAEGGLRALLEPPFDLATAPLWRFELLDGGERGQILVYGAHHAVSDLQSLLLVASEIDAELTTGPLGDTLTNREAHQLIEAQRADGPGGTDEWQETFRGSARLDLALSRPRPTTRTYRAGSVTLPIPDGLPARIAAAAGALAVTPAAFCLGVLTVLLARRRERERFVLAVPVDTRIHADAYDAVGFFGVPVPFPAEARAGERIEEVLRRTDGRLEKVLTKGAMFSDVLPVLAEEGLYRADAPLVEVYFNHVRSGGGLKALEVLPAGTGYSDLDLMVTMTPDAGRIRLDHNLDILDAGAVTGLGEELLRLLADTADDPSGPVRTQAPVAGPGHRLALAATFALGNLPRMCEAAVGAVTPGTPVGVAEAPYHQVPAALRDPSGVFADPATTAGVVLLRATDLQRFGPVDDDRLAELRTAYPAAVRAAAERGRTPLIVGVLPCAHTEERLARWEREVAADLAEVPGVAVLGPDTWTRDHGVDQPFDERTERLAHLPFTAPFQAAVALRLAEAVRAAHRPAPKVIAVDGDGTLWDGVAGEAGPEGVEPGGARALLARRLLQWRAAGALLALVSNNDEDTVRAVLDRPDSLLKAEHFSVISAAWEPKPDRLAEAARTLGLGLDSFLFLDDNPAEIARMRAAAPQVLSVTCPDAGELPAFLDRLWPVVPVAATAEDALRARFYAQERQRDAVREETGFEEFLDQLRLEVDVRALTDADVGRAEQLVRRTNQFTLRARSADGGDVRRWREDGEVWTASARDRFGDYGQIGLLALRTEGDRLDVTGWLLSCRALGRGVEERLLDWLAGRAEELGCAEVRLTAQRTPRNTPARRLLAALGGGDLDGDRLEAVVTPDRLRAFRSWRRP